MCSGGMEDWQSSGAWLLPPTEEVGENGVCMERALLVVEGALVMALEMLV